MNGFSWTTRGKKSTIASIDSLYAGDLWQELDQEVDLLASHTHFAPMIDSQKPMLGEFSKVALNIWKNSFYNKRSQTYEIDSIHYFRANSAIPIYRRFDNRGNMFGILTNRFIGMFPNSKEPVDKNINIYIFNSEGRARFCFIWHCCHPVSRRRRNVYSADFIAIIRNSIRERFGEIPVIFANGPSGDIRPKVLKKRIKFLPEWSFNLKFSLPNLASEIYVDQTYEKAIDEMEFIKTFPTINPRVFERKIKVEGFGILEIKTFSFCDELAFCFLPFEVSHRYHNISKSKGVFIASCANHVFGYLPHKTQHFYGGYEVDKSRKSMSLKRRIFLSENELATYLSSTDTN
jgi:hypothetical protein